MYWTGKSMNNLLSYCGLVAPRISASDKDLPVSLYDLCYVIAVLLFFKYSLYMRQKEPTKSLNSTLSMMDNIFWDIKPNLSGNIPNYRKPM